MGYGYSWDQAKKMGKDADLQIQQQYGLYDNDELQRYVDKIGQIALIGGAIAGETLLGLTGVDILGIGRGNEVAVSLPLD